MSLFAAGEEANTISDVYTLTTLSSPLSSSSPRWPSGSNTRHR